MLTQKQIEWLENKDPHKYDDKAENYSQMMKGRILKKFKKMQESVSLMAEYWNKITPIYSITARKENGEEIRIYDNVMEQLEKALKLIKQKGIYTTTSFYDME